MLQGELQTIRQLAGVLPALVTPLHQDGSFDEAGSRAVVRRCLDADVNGLLALGSTGEMASLPESVRRAQVETVVDEAAGRVPVLMGVAQVSLQRAVEDIQFAQRSGASAALVTPPYYTPIDQETVAGWYRSLHAKCPDMPLLVYNIPGFTKVSVDPRVIASLAEDGIVAGTKDSSRDYDHLCDVLVATRHVEGFRVFTGSDQQLLGSLAMGASGTIAASVNVAPSWAVRIVDAMRAGDWAAAQRFQDDQIRLNQALRVGVFPSGHKAALEVLGVCQRWMGTPTPSANDAAVERLRGQLSELGLLAIKEPAAA
ncbi:MAG TPA: dihydrodipicolinate synthase family protein [Chloroflexota bacterium]|nr:dihydrodipicolinate synthase family protein [Chloroflexota bacterium]